MKDIKIVIAAHKQYRMPEDKMYIPIQVGADGKEWIGFIPDNTGDNISEKNPFYCELTGVYWAWKNLDCDYLGLAHYRRHFCLKKKNTDPFMNVLSLSEADKLFDDVDLVLPKRRNYYIETLESHFNHVRLVQDSDLPLLREAIQYVDAQYVAAFDKCIHRTWGHMFNMFIMKRELLDDYCNWFFSVLNYVENNIDMSVELHPSRRRIIGYLAEFLLDVWIEQKQVKYTEIDTVFMEKTNEVKKIYKFLIRKFRK